MAGDPGSPSSISSSSSLSFRWYQEREAQQEGRIVWKKTHTDLEVRKEMLSFPVCSLVMCAMRTCPSVCVHACVRVRVWNALLPLHYEHSTGSHDDRQEAAVSGPR